MLERILIKKHKLHSLCGRDLLLCVLIYLCHAPINMAPSLCLIFIICHRILIELAI